MPTCRAGGACLTPRPGKVLQPPYGPPAMRGDGRNMLRPYGLTRIYPGQGGRRAGVSPTP